MPVLRWVAELGENVKMWQILKPHFRPFSGRCQWREQEMLSAGFWRKTEEQRSPVSVSFIERTFFF